MAIVYPAEVWPCDFYTRHSSASLYAQVLINLSCFVILSTP